MKIGLVIAAIVGIGGVVVYSLLTSSSPKELEFQAILSTIRESNGALLDVRTAEEFASQHIEDATLLPLQSIETGELPEVEKTAPIYVYCRSGNRSAQAVKLLADAGYTQVTDLGGIQDVIRLGASTKP